MYPISHPFIQPINNTPLSRQLEKASLLYSEGRGLKEYIEKIGQKKGLEMLYEHLSYQRDCFGVTIVELLIQTIEEQSSVKPDSKSLAPFYQPQHQKERVEHQPPQQMVQEQEIYPSEQNIQEAPAPQEVEKKSKRQKRHKKGTVETGGKGEPQEMIITEEVSKKDDKKYPMHEDDGFGALEYEIYDASDLKLLPSVMGPTIRYLKISDISPNFNYIYVNQYDEAAIEQVYQRFLGQEYIGIDSEFHLRNCKATYLQLASIDFGVVFNIRNVKFRDDPRFKLKLKALFESNGILKVGHSLRQDVRVIKQAFFGELDFNGTYSLDDELFTCRTNVLGLSSICLRLFGYPLNKDFQSWVGEEEELDGDEEKEYVILDALAPAVIYSHLKNACRASIKRETFTINCAERKDMDTSEFLLDHQMELLRVFFERVNVQFSVLKDKTYAGSLFIISRDKGHRQRRSQVLHYF